MRLNAAHFQGGPMRAVFQWLLGKGTWNTLTGSQSPQNTTPDRFIESGVDTFLRDILPRIHQLDGRRLPRTEQLRGWMLVTDRGVSPSVPRAKGCCLVHVEDEIGTQGSFSLLSCIDTYFTNTGNIPAAACLLYAIQDQVQVADVQEVQRAYHELPIVIVMPSTDPDNVAKMRALHASSWTNFVDLVVLPKDGDVQSFLNEIIGYL